MSSRKFFLSTDSIDQSPDWAPEEPLRRSSEATPQNLRKKPSVVARSSATGSTPTRSKTTGGTSSVRSAARSSAHSTTGKRHGERPKFQEPFQTTFPGQSTPLEDESTTPRGETSVSPFRRSMSMERPERRKSSRDGRYQGQRDLRVSQAPRPEYFDLSSTSEQRQDPRKSSRKGENTRQDPRDTKLQAPPIQYIPHSPVDEEVNSPGQPPSAWRESPTHRSRPPTSEPQALGAIAVNTSQQQQFQYPDQALHVLQSFPNAPPPRPSRMRSQKTHNRPVPRHASTTESSSAMSTATSSEAYNTSSTAIHDPDNHRSIASEDISHTGVRSRNRTPALTPSQSPGLYTPPFSPASHAPDSEDGRQSQILHASHMIEPKETHKLNKDVDPTTGRKFLNNYELIDKIGSGQHGTVKLGKNLDTGQYVAVKIVRRFSKKVRLGKAGNPNDTIKKEVAILKKARHPHVVSLFEVIDDEQYEKVYLVLEYVERGEIVWRKATEKAIARFEMARLDRERFGGFNEAFENQAVGEFNSGVPQRRVHRENILAECRREALDRLGPEFVEAPPRSRGVTHWSLEYGGESEYEASLAGSSREHLPEDNTRMSRADLHAAVTAAQSRQESASPFRIMNPFARAAEVDHRKSSPSSKASSIRPSAAPSPRRSPWPSAPASRDPSRPVTRPHTPSVDESLYTAHLEEHLKADAQLQLMIDRVLAEHEVEHGEHWTQEEEIHRHVPCLTLHQALEAFRDTVLGLEYLHYQGIIHRDIKPANLLWTHDYRVKISDFGVSYLGKPIHEDSRDSVAEHEPSSANEALELAKTVGTPAFYAPELCDPALFEVGRKRARPEITGQIDVWALGVTLYGMIFGRLPFFDVNEFIMYEKIAREEVFIPRRRLKGVEHNKKRPTHHDKRAEDVLEYQDVDESLRDLLKKLLKKDPSQRISLAEVKHHPWVVSGLENKEGWFDETDPSRQSEGRKIEVSNQDVQDAVIGITFFERIKTGFTQRMSSVFRGRSTRNRATSSVKTADNIGHASASDRREDRRASLRSDEQIFSALRASRDGVEHPLAQSLAPSPDFAPSVASYFAGDEGTRPLSAFERSLAHRPLASQRSLTTDESMKTVKASETNRSRHSILPTSTSAPGFGTDPDDPVALTAAPVPDGGDTSSQSSLASILSGASRKLVRSMRSRDLGNFRPSGSVSGSSRSSSKGTSSDQLSANLEQFHAQPCLGLSSAVAAGQLDPALDILDNVQPPPLHQLSPKSSADSFQQRAIENSRRRRQGEASSARSIDHSSPRNCLDDRPLTPKKRHALGHRRTTSSQVDYSSPPSPTSASADPASDVTTSPRSPSYRPTRPVSVADSSSFATMSSSDRVGSGASTVYSSIPSVVSGASSVSGPTVEDKDDTPVPLNRHQSSRARTKPSSGPVTSPVLDHSTPSSRRGSKTQQVSTGSSKNKTRPSVSTLTQSSTSRDGRRRQSSSTPRRRSNSTTISPRQHRHSPDDEAGYTGEVEEDSDEEPLAIA